MGRLEASGRKKLLVAGGTVKRDLQCETGDRKFNASDMLSHCPSAEELRKFHVWLPHKDSDERKRPFSRVDAEGDACSKGYCICCEVGEKLNSCVAVANHFASDEFVYLEDSSGSDQM